MAGGPRLIFVLSKFQNAFFHELAEVLAHEVRSIGGHGEVVTTPVIEPHDDDVYVLLPAHEYMALEGEAWAQQPGLVQRTMFVTAEQPGSHFFHGNLAHAARAGAVFDFSPLAVRAYRKRGVKAMHLPFGYTELWDRYDTEHFDRGTDVVFMGCATERRNRILGELTPVLAPRRTRLVVSDNSAPNYEASGSFLTGDEKRRLLASTRVLLNLHQTDEPYFEWLRITEAVLCGTVVVTEPSVGTSVFEPGEHVVVSTIDALPHVLDAVLDDSALQDRVRKAAYDRLRETPTALAAERLLETGDRLRRLPVPKRVAGPTRRRPFARPVPEFERLDSTSDGSVLRQALRESRLDAMDLRRRFETLNLQTTTGRAPSAVETRVATPAYRLRRTAPEISVIMALYNHSAFVAAALDSVAHSSVADVEIVVVDDGSTDRSGDVVASWMAEHPEVPAVLLQHPVNRGLPVSRNDALAVAAGDLVFVLDADNEVLPTGFAALREALQRDPDAWFAYGLLQRFDEQGSNGLLGYLGWAPGLLRYGNYIDAMALVRTERLRQMSGYTTDRRLYGWEDYDLWCRMAEAGGRAAHVPNMVGRYRASATSMLSLSNISLIPAWTALKEHCPNLFAPTPIEPPEDVNAHLAERFLARARPQG